MKIDHKIEVVHITNVSEKLIEDLQNIGESLPLEGYICVQDLIGYEEKTKAINELIKFCDTNRLYQVAIKDFNY